ncbi:hypothetical protein [Gill-associated virus]|uniref:Uncharacterized protein n=1 Tax=Gill-associated virus (isolate Giant tiger prawn/Australia) TaxID=649894 RepID=Q8JNK8_GAVAU|nr:hypothetical protein [Gill-associated virus]AAK84671.1 unknown [Gill-associated virus]
MIQIPNIMIKQQKIVISQGSTQALPFLNHDRDSIPLMIETMGGGLVLHSFSMRFAKRGPFLVPGVKNSDWKTTSPRNNSLAPN